MPVAFGSAEGGGDAWLSNGPGNNESGECGVELCGDGSEFIEKIVVALVFVSLEHWIFVPAVLWRKDVLAGQLPCEESFEEGPVDAGGDVVLSAPGEYLGFDFALEEIVGGLNGSERTDGVELAELSEAEVGGAGGDDKSIANEIRDGSGGFFDGDFGIRRMEVVEVNVFALKLIEGVLALLFEGFWSGIVELYAITSCESAFGGDDDFGAVTAEGLGKE